MNIHISDPICARSAGGEALPSRPRVNIDDCIKFDIRHLYGPPPTRPEILRARIETAIERLIALLDALDGDPDAEDSDLHEDDDPAEDDDPGEEEPDEDDEFAEAFA